MNMHRLTAILIAFSLLGGAACGSSDDTAGSDETASSGADDAMIEAVVEMLMQDSDLALIEEEARCAAVKAVDTIGPELAMSAFAPDSDTTENLDPEIQGEFMTAMLDCIDFNRAMVDSMIADGATREEAECMAGAFGEDELRDLVSMSALGEDEMDEEQAMMLFASLLSASATCGFME
jgi:hypothetical protein